MKFKTITFIYTGEIAKNYGVDGTAIVKKGLEFTPDNIKDEGIANVWVREGFAEYKEDDAKKPKEETPKYEDVSKEELEDEIKEEEVIEDVQLDVEEVQKEAPKKRGRPARK